MVKKEAVNATLWYLNKLKNKHSKSTKLDSTKLKSQDYLFNESLNPREMKLLFQFRTRMFDCGGNFENLYAGASFCKLCKISRETQSHLFDCYVLKNSITKLRVNQNVKYDHIFENNERQVEALKLIDHIITNREILLEALVPN